jgi:hypothetical protein
MIHDEKAFQLVRQLEGLQTTLTYVQRTLDSMRNELEAAVGGKGARSYPSHEHCYELYDPAMKHLGMTKKSKWKEIYAALVAERSRTPAQALYKKPFPKKPSQVVSRWRRRYQSSAQASWIIAR